MRREGREPLPDHAGALFRCARPSGVPRGPATSTGSLASQRHPAFSGLPPPGGSPGCLPRLLFFSLLIATGEAIPLRGLEGVPGLPGAPHNEAGLTRKFETSHVGGATCRTPPIPRSALEKDPRPGPLFEGNPMGEGIQAWAQSPCPELSAQGLVPLRWDCALPSPNAPGKATSRISS